MRASRLLSALAFVSVALASSLAGASPITVTFSGTLTEIFHDGQAGIDAFARGTPFSGSFTFDSGVGAVDGDPNPRLGVYDAAGSPFDLSVSLGGVSFFASPALDSQLRFIVFDGPIRFDDDFTQTFDLFNLGAFGVRTAGLSGPFAQGPVSIGLNLSTDGDGILTSDSLLAVPFDLARFPDAAFSVNLGNGDVIALGRIDRLVVPEPGAAGLLALGLALLVRRRR